jgi:hypothetical protein
MGHEAENPAKIVAAFAPYVEFVEPVEGGRGPGLILKPGFEAVVRDTNQGAAVSRSSDKGRLDAEAWDWDDESLPPLNWQNEDRANQIERWRASPET